VKRWYAESSTFCSLRPAEGLIVRARELRPEGGALYWILSCKIVFALFGCGRSYVTYGIRFSCARYRRL